jgi:hypothetical protein
MNEQKATLPDRFMTAGALAFGILFVWLLYGKIPGISIPLFLIAFYALLLVYAKPVIKREEALFGWILCIPILLLSLTYVVFGNVFFKILNLLVLPLLVLLQTLLVTGANSFKWDSPGIFAELLFGIFYRCLAHVAKPFRIVSGLFRKNQSGAGTKSVAFRILTGILISLPLLLILLALLSSADMVFGKLMERVAKLFEVISLPDVIGKILAALMIFFLTFSYLWSIRHGERMQESTIKGLMPETATQKGLWDPIMIITVTAAVNILYIVFVIIQFAYLFGGAGLPDGFTYAEYARSGFFELVFVTLLNIGFLVCTLTFTKKGGSLEALLLRILNTLMIGCTFVMLYSAHFRMSLYEEAYGYTFLRVMTHAFMVFLLALFLVTLARVWKDGLPLLKPYMIIAITAFVIVNYINVDMIIARKNIEQYSTTGAIDIAYFDVLSSSAVAELKSLTQDKNPDTAKAAAKLLEQRKEELNRNTPWQSFNLADYRARIELNR